MPSSPNAVADQYGSDLMIRVGVSLALFFAGIMCVGTAFLFGIAFREAITSSAIAMVVIWQSWTTLFLVVGLACTVAGIVSAIFGFLDRRVNRVRSSYRGVRSL